MFELVKGIVDLMATRLQHASQLKVGTSVVFTLFAEGCFTTEHSWSASKLITTQMFIGRTEKYYCAVGGGITDLNDIPHG